MLVCDFWEGDIACKGGAGTLNLDSTVSLDGLVETIEVGQSGNVSLNASNVAADRLHGRVELFLTAARDEDVGALFYEQLCSGQPYPGCATGNDCHFSLQLLIFRHRLFPHSAC